MRIRVATYNIQRGFGLDLRCDLERTLAILRRVDADVVALQELTCRGGDAPNDQPTFLAGALGMELVRCDVRPHGGGSYGHAVLSRLTVRDAETCDLSVPGCEPRRCLRVDLGFGVRTLQLFACHFGLGARERARQAAALVYFTRERSNGARIVLGDFNEWYAGPVARALGAELGAGGARLPTHPAPLPIFPIDRIYWDRVWSGDTRVFVERRARVASDHLPVVAELSN